MDATTQPSRPPRGRGPFPGSAFPGHSSGLPVRLASSVRSSALRPDGTLEADFVITNLSTKSLRLPSSVDQNLRQQTSSLTLWLTSDGIKDQYFRDTASGDLVKIAAVGISAELNGSIDDPRSFIMLPPNQSLRVRAPPVQFKPGSQTITAHAELLRFITTSSSISSETVGTADAESVTTPLLTSDPATR